MFKDFIEEFTARLRTKIDYPLFCIRIGLINVPVMLVNVIFLIDALRPGFWVKPMSWVVMLVFLFNIGWQICMIILDWNKYIKSTDFHYETDGIKASDFILSKEVSNRYECAYIEGLKEMILYSKDLNRQLNKPINIVVNEEKAKRTLKHIKFNKDILSHFLNVKWQDMKHKNGNFFNDKKVCQASEIEVYSDESGEELSVALCHGTYYNSFVTNNIFTTKLMDNHAMQLLPPIYYKFHPVMPLDESVMSDHIGVSTLAVTSDGYAILMRQNNKSVISTNRFQPSGSGSMDAGDINKATTLNEAIEACAYRELCEETGLDKSYIDRIEIKGFYRDLKRGGKPEYVCVTYLNTPKIKISIKPQCLEQAAYRFTSQIMKDGVINPDLLWESILEITQNNSYSFPLYMVYFVLSLEANGNRKNDDSSGSLPKCAKAVSRNSLQHIHELPPLKTQN